MEKNEDKHQKEPKSEKSMVHLAHKLTGTNFEDLVSSIGVILVSVIFILYVSISAYAASIPLQNSGSNGALKNTNKPVFSLFASEVKCDKMNGDFEACVQSQSEGSGCSWYAGCSACIAGSHEGRSREEMCGNK